MPLRLATIADIPAIAALESNPLARQFVGQWSEARHHTTPAGGDARYYVNESDAGAIEAYVILRGLKQDFRSIELKRIVAVPERGMGRRVLNEMSMLESEYN
jgi:hypothetical protein